MTDVEFDLVYESGKLAWQRDYGSRGPTARNVAFKKTPNPHTGDRAVAWERGYQQDVRRH